MVLLLAEGFVVLDDVTKIVDILAKLIGVIVWPAVIIFILVRFGKIIGTLLSSLTEFSIKGAGFEASGKMKTEAAAALGAALVKQRSSESVPDDPRLASQVVESVPPRVVQQASKSNILWVDDHPENNIHERRSLEAFGINIVPAESTEEALARIREQSFDAIISDMGRAGDSEAGLTLLDKLRAAGNFTPFIIYAAARAIQLRSKALQKGALGSTNRPDELFKLTLSAIGKRQI